MIKLIGLSGKLGAGKDTVGRIIQCIAAIRDNQFKGNFKEFLEFVEEEEEEDINSRVSWAIKKYAYKLKLIASVLTGIPIYKFEDQDFKKTILGPEWDYISENVEVPMTVREFLQKLGTDAIRDGLHKNTWTNALFADLGEYDKWIITDVRFPNEADEIRKRGGIIVRINRNEDTGNHPSETALDSYNFDYVINNTGTIEELENKAADMLKHFKIYE